MKNRKIAIIDQDMKAIRELKEILSFCGYTPVPVIDSLLAVNTIIKSNLDLILMDLRMPRQRGFEITYTINRVCETKGVPIIAISDSHKDEFRGLLEFRGINRWIKKPFQPLNLIWAIENEIEHGNQWNKGNRLAEAGIPV